MRVAYDLRGFVSSWLEFDSGLSRRLCVAALGTANVENGKIVSSLRVKIDRKAIDDMIAHAREAAPNECCGLLVGRRGAIDRVVRARNLHDSPTRYSIDPADHFGAIHAARSQGQAVIGAYHSHPASSAAPSESDISEATGGSEFLYVIVSLVEGAGAENLCVYRVRHGRVERVDLISAAK